MANNNIIENYDDSDFEYVIVVKKQSDIISELTNDIDEQLIYESIIDGIEKTAAATVRGNKIAQLPSIGCIRKSPIHIAIQNSHDDFRELRRNMTSEQYKTHVKEFIINTRKEQEKSDKEKALVKKIRSRNKKKYDMLHINIGKAYAEMYIKSILFLQEVPYVTEVQYHFDKLNNLV